MDLSKWSPMTVLAIVVIVILLIAGAVVTVAHPESLSFSDYFDDVTKVLAALGLAVPIGRGIHFGLRDQNPAPVPAATVLEPLLARQEQTWMPASDVMPNAEGSDSEDNDEDVPLPPRGQHA